MWHCVARTDARARQLADRHYSRKTPGAPEFCQPGNNIVLIIPDGCAARAVWVTHRPDPNANLAVPRADGMDYWDCSIFRNESGLQSSPLILEALRVTRYLWRDSLPLDGIHTFVDPRQVKPIKRRGENFWGYSFFKAGFDMWPERTQQRKLIRYVMPLRRFQLLEPIAPGYEQLPLPLRVT